MSKLKQPDTAPDAPAIVTRKPHVDYPCTWPYTVIGEDGDALERKLPEALAGEDAQMQRKRASRTGRYSSFQVAVRVRDEEHRDRVFRGLRAIHLVKVVL